MTFSQAKAKARNPGAFTTGDKWMVKNSVSGQPVEGAFSEAKAIRAAAVCNEQEQRNGRPAVYTVEALD